MQVKRFLKDSKIFNGKQPNFYEIRDNVIEALEKKIGCKAENNTITAKEIPSTYPDSEKLEKISKYCVLFSGGCDSLTLALRHLENGDNVALCHIVFNEEESIAAYLLYKRLKEIYGSKVLGFFRLFDPVCMPYSEDRAGWGQQPITAFYASWIPRCLKTNCKAIESAYIMNDDAVSYEKELKAIYNNAVSLKAEGIKMPPYNFPLKKYKHEDNQIYIADIERKYNTKFPFSSADGTQKMYSCKFTNNGIVQTAYFYDCYTDSEKENKKNDIFCYIILDDPEYENGFDLAELANEAVSRREQQLAFCFEIEPKPRQLQIQFEENIEE